MTDRPASPDDPHLPELLKLVNHELRTPITVVAGYISMLLKDRAGPISDAQRRMLEEAQKSTGRLSALMREVSDLAELESGSVEFSRSAVDLGALLEETAAALPPLPDREVSVAVENAASGAAVLGDPARLKTAFTSLMLGLRREIVTSTKLIVRLRRAAGSADRRLRIAIAGDGHTGELDNMGAGDLATFNEWRGGCGLTLPIARYILAAHGGCIASPTAPPREPGTVAGEKLEKWAVVVLPEA